MGLHRIYHIYGIYIKTRNKAVGNELPELPLVPWIQFQDVRIPFPSCPSNVPPLNKSRATGICLVLLQLQKLGQDEAIWLWWKEISDSLPWCEMMGQTLLRFAKTLAKMSSKNDWLPPLSINWFRWGPPRYIVAKLSQNDPSIATVRLMLYKWKVYPSGF